MFAGVATQDGERAHFNLVLLERTRRLGSGEEHPLRGIASTSVVEDIQRLQGSTQVVANSGSVPWAWFTVLRLADYDQLLQRTGTFRLAHAL